MDESSLKELLERAKRLCPRFLGTRWVNPENIEAHLLRGGFTNRVIKCSLSSSDGQADGSNHVVVRFISGDGRILGTMGEAGETLAVYKLSAEGIGPQLLGVFPGGRIEQFVTGRTLIVSDMRDEHVAIELAQKLARIHSLNIPINKNPLAIFHNFVLQYDQKLVDSIDYTIFPESIQEKARLLYEMDLEQEMNWFIHLIPEHTRGSRVVFSHGDFHAQNLMLIEERESWEDHKSGSKVIVLDVESGCYTFRGMDFGAYFLERKFDSLDPEISSFAKPSEADKSWFVAEYLKEWKMQNEPLFDPLVDNVEVICAEADFFELARLLVYLRFTFHFFARNAKLPEAVWDFALLRKSIFFDMKTKYST